MATIQFRSEAQLLRQLAREVRRRPVHDFEDALHQVMAGESHDRWTNLIHALGTDLCTQPINGYDVDELHVGDGRRDHPAAYAHRLHIAAVRIGDPQLVAATFDALAAAVDAELADPHRARIGGRALLNGRGRP